MSHSFETSPSDPSVPGIASFGRRGAQTRSEPFHTVGDRQVSDEFHVLVAELAGEPHTKRAAVAHGKFIAIQPIGEKSLRMDSHNIQYVGERHADPLGYIRPAFFTRQVSDLTARRIAPQLGKRKRGG